MSTDLARVYRHHHGSLHSEDYEKAQSEHEPNEAAAAVEHVAGGYLEASVGRGMSQDESMAHGKWMPAWPPLAHPTSPRA